MSPLFGAVVLLFACGVQSAVIELDDNSFYNYAKDRDVLLVDFYAPWCSDCKNLEPDFQAAGVSLGARSIDLAKVDCFGAGKGLCNSFGIKEWPTLKNFNRGKYTGDYTGGLTAGEIAGYVNTVENSANPQAVSNPYASPYQPMAIATQQCVSRCKISKITNKAPCYAKCKSPKPAGRKMLPQPVINEKSCAKCRQPLIAGKFKSTGETFSKRNVLHKVAKSEAHPSGAKSEALIPGAKRDDLLLAAMDGRNAFVLGEKKPNPFDPQIQYAIKPAPGHEEEHLNTSTLAMIPGGLQDALIENATETRTLDEDNQVPQKIPKHTRSWERQFFQARPVLSRPVNFSLVLGMASSKVNKTKQTYLDGQTDTEGTEVREVTKPGDVSSPAVQSGTLTASSDTPVPQSTTVEPLTKTDTPDAPTNVSSVQSNNLVAQSDTPAAQSDNLAASADAPVAQSDTPDANTDNLAAQTDAPIAQSDTPAAQSDTLAAQSDNLAARADAPVAQSYTPAAPQAYTPAAQPEKSVKRPKKPVVQPDVPAAQPDIPAAQPENPTVGPEKPAAQPQKPSTQPGKPVQPEKPTILLRRPPVQPQKPAVQPDKPVVQPDKPVLKPNKPVVKADEKSESLADGRVYETVKSRESLSGSPSDTKNKLAWNAMMSMIQNSGVTKGQTIASTYANKEVKSTTPAHSNRNTAVLLDILTPEEASKLPYVATDKKKTVAKHHKKGRVDAVVSRKHLIHRRVHKKHSRSLKY